MQDTLHHVGFTVAKMEPSIEFYSLLLQAEPAMRRKYDEQFISDVVGYEETLLDCALFVIPGSGVILELLEYLRPESARVDMETNNVGNAHLCLIVDDLEREYRRLLEHGVEFRSPPVDVPADIEDDPAKGGRALYLRDPDGITVELLEMPMKPA